MPARLAPGRSWPPADPRGRSRAVVAAAPDSPESEKSSPGCVLPWAAGTDLLMLRRLGRIGHGSANWSVRARIARRRWGESMKLLRRSFLRLAAAAVALPAVSQAVWAQTHPARPI